MRSHGSHNSPRLTASRPAARIPCTHLPDVDARPQRLHQRPDRQCSGAARVPVVGSQRRHQAARRRVRRRRSMDRNSSSCIIL